MPAPGYVPPAPFSPYPLEYATYFLSSLPTHAANAPLQATRVLIARKLKGLDDIVSFSAVHWHMGEGGKPARTCGDAPSCF